MELHDLLINATGNAFLEALKAAVQSNISLSELGGLYRLLQLQISAYERMPNQSNPFLQQMQKFMKQLCIHQEEKDYKIQAYQANRQQMVSLFGFGNQKLAPTAHEKIQTSPDKVFMENLATDISQLSAHARIYPMLLM
jgi:hypothetical protein